MISTSQAQPFDGFATTPALPLSAAAIQPQPLAAYGLDTALLPPQSSSSGGAIASEVGNNLNIFITPTTDSLINNFLLTDNTLATANIIGDIIGTQTRTGFVGSTDLVDYYRINLTGIGATNSLNLTLTGLSADADLLLVRDINGNGNMETDEVIAYSSRVGASDESLNLHNLTGGQYFVGVRQWSGDTSYSLRLSNNFTSNLLATETNIGTLAGTQTFTNPSFAEGEISARREGILTSDTSDLYRFSLSTVRNVSLALTGISAGADLDLRLIQDLNGNGLVDPNEVLAASTHSSNWNEALNRNLDVGNYFVQVSRWSGNSNYSLRLTESAPQVEFTINQVQALNNPDSGWFGDDADFYSRVWINGTPLTTGAISNSNNIAPNWNFTQTVTGRTVSIEVELWDSDGGLAGNDDRIDIDPGAGQNLNLTFDIVTGAITGDVNGFGGQLLSLAGASGDRARMWFTVDTGDWYTLNLKDSGVEDLTRSFAADGQLSRMDMINLMRDTQDGNTVNADELTDLRTVLNRLNYLMPEHVRVLSNKVVNSDPANTVSGIGNLFAGSSANQMENLIGKWFLGTDRPDAFSNDRRTAYTYQSVSGNLFQNGISYRDVNQNDLGDCYFLAALGAMALDSPTRIQDMFVSQNDDNGDGIIDSWTVRMFNNGVADYVTVDRFLPTNGGFATFAGWGRGHFTNSNNELWVALLEKAYAQFNESGWTGQDGTNSYNGTSLSPTPVANNNAGINGGWPDLVLEQLTGLDASTTAMSATNSVNQMINAFMNYRMVALNTPDTPGTSLIVGRHAYTLVGYNAANDTFQVYNPWAFDGGSSVDGADDGIRWLTRSQLIAGFSSWAALA